LKIIDISLPINERTLTYQNDPPPKFTKLLERVSNVGFETTLIEILTHTGTHFDAPSHFYQGGKTIDKIPLELLIGEGYVVSLSLEGSIQWDFDMMNKIVLLKTGEGKNLKEEIFSENYVTPEIETVQLLIHNKVKAVGIDTLSIDSFKDENATNHALLLNANIPVIEGLYLENASPGKYFCVLMPLYLQGLDGAPGRCVLIEW
jgi:arylformamidase